MGGDLLRFDEANEDDKKLESEFTLCSRTFRNRRGEFRSPRNIFLHGRGGAKNLSCLYRFEANVGEQVGLLLIVAVDRKRVGRGFLWALLTLRNEAFFGPCLPP